MAISTKSSVLALKEETTEGTLVLPTAASDYVALQPDGAMAPAIASNTNDEIRASIGASKPILGAEAPTFTVSHYLRHSGVEGQAPNYHLMPKALFGSEVVASVEYDTVAASTTSVIKVNTGEGVNFQRGQALLLKDPVNGYRIRFIESVSGDNLTIGFQVPTAPGVGVNLGKAVTYVPVNSGHPTLSVLHYLGNGGAVQAMAGGRVVSGKFTATAGALVNASYSLEGVGYYFNPVEITASTDTLDFYDGASSFAVTVEDKVFKNPEALAESLETLMNAAGAADNYTVSFSKTTGKYTFVSDGTTFELRWNTGTNTAQSIASKIGFSTAADSTGATTYTSATAEVLAAPQTPSYDSADPLAAKNQEVMVGDTSDYLCFDASSVELTVGTPKTNIQSICAESGISGSVINERTDEVKISALLSQYDSSIFHKYQKGSNVKFQYSFGEKSGGNWVAGKSGCLSMPTATVSSYDVVDQNGLVALNMTLTGYVDAAGEGEVFLSFV